MNRTEIFNECRPLLMAIAYRMLGSRADAEDAVQETFLLWQESNEEPTSPKSFLATIITRLCIDQLRSARAQREVYLGPWRPERFRSAMEAAKRERRCIQFTEPARSLGSSWAC